MIVKLSSQMPPTRMRYCLRYFSNKLEQKPSHRFLPPVWGWYTVIRISVNSSGNAGSKGWVGLCYCDFYSLIGTLGILSDIGGHSIRQGLRHVRTANRINQMILA